jgi:site-specific DNA recombinase
LLRREFEEHGTTIRALNDRGDDTPEGELTDGILDQLAKFERAKTAERTRRGKLRKAREGKLIAGHAPKYGFQYNENRTGYLVDETAIGVVRRIFEAVASGTPMWAVKAALEAEGIPAPGGGRRWSQTTLREMIQSDSYKPHTVEEFMELVSTAVVASLDPDKRYGISWYGRRRTRLKQVAECGPNGQRTYRHKQETTAKPREEWVGVLVPDSGLPRSLVDAARDAIKDNVWPSSAGRRFWELSGGIAVCGGCGKHLRHIHRKHKGKEGVFYNYYGCPSSQERKIVRVCQNGKGRRAEDLEEQVWSFASSLLKDPELLRRGLTRLIESERSSLRGDPDREARAWLERLSTLERKRRGFQEITAEGLMGLSELKERLAELDEEREVAEEALEALKLKRGRLEALERDAEDLLASYAGMVPEGLDALSPEERQRVYKMLHLKVYTYADGGTELEGIFTLRDGFTVRTSRHHRPQNGEGAHDPAPLSRGRRQLRLGRLERRHQ